MFSVCNIMMQLMDMFLVLIACIFDLREEAVNVCVRACVCMCMCCGVWVKEISKLSY